MSDLRELYQEVILDHYRKPRNQAVPAAANREAAGHNPLCGDRVTVHLDVADGIIRDAGFEGAGCAISIASASLMTEAVKGKSVAEAKALFKTFRGVVMGDTADRDNADSTADLGKLEVLSGVREYPVRVKCATLAWHTLDSAIESGDEVVSTEN